MLAHGQALGLISAHVGDKHLSEYPYGVEWASFLFPGELLAKGHRIRFRDATPTRQVAYWNLLPPDYKRLLVPAAQTNGETALAMAAFAEVSALSEPDILSSENVGEPAKVDTSSQH